MSTLEFILSLVSTLIWPSVILLAVWIVRREMPSYKSRRLYRR